jgi:putative NADPH-quinone reductase
MSTTGKLFEDIILITVQRYTEEKGVLNASQFGFRARHSTTLHSMRLTDHVTLNFTITSLGFLYPWILKKPFDKIWHVGLLYKLSTLQFSICLIKIISSSLSERKFRV